LLAALLFVLLLRAPFLDQAVQGDDVNYLAAAQHAQIDPLHPNHVRYVFQGVMVDMRGHPHPPLNGWILAALLAMVGDIREVPFHAAYILFSLIAAASMYSLARRFSPEPLLATLLLVLTPAFVINGTSLESDLPFLAFWLWAVAAFVKAAHQGSQAWLALSVIGMSLAAMTAFQAIVLMPILGLYLWKERRGWKAGWVALFAVPAVLAGYQLFELITRGAMPATILSGYMQSYGFQRIVNKLKNAGALTVHLGWIVFPVLAVAAFRMNRRWLALPAVAALVGALFLDPHPLFWISFGTGVLVLVWCALHSRDFLAAWVLIFFAAAVVIFFAGSARYLLPLAAPVALLTSRALKRRWLIGGVAAQALLSLSLAASNYEHWDGYRRFVVNHERSWENKRVWTNGEWGLRFYAESAGALSLERGQKARLGELMLSSRLTLPVAFDVGTGLPARVAEEEIDSWLPVRIMGLNSRSGYSSASTGLRPFDISTAPLDVIRLETIVERKPTLSFLTTNDPAAAQHILSGVFPDRWMGGRAAILLQAPAAAAKVEVQIYLPDAAPARRIVVSLDGSVVIDQVVARTGVHTLSSTPVKSPGDSASLAIEVDKTFRVPNDERDLGAVLLSAGFR
jgi:4-amino-4-deoxy-L-arabinose transferase-like glycosyltransferase